jgi:hypothetical protein
MKTTCMLFSDFFKILLIYVYDMYTENPCVYDIFIYRIMWNENWEKNVLDWYFGDNSIKDVRKLAPLPSHTPVGRRKPSLFLIEQQ